MLKHWIRSNSRIKWQVNCMELWLESQSFCHTPGTPSLSKADSLGMGWHGTTPFAKRACCISAILNSMKQTGFGTVRTGCSQMRQQKLRSVPEEKPPVLHLHSLGVVYLWHRAHLRHGPQCYPSLPLHWRVIHNLMFLRPRNSETRVQGGEADGHAATRSLGPGSSQLPHCIILTVYGDGRIHWGLPQGSCDSAIAGKMAWPSIGLAHRGHFWMNGPFGTLGTNTNGEERQVLSMCLLCHSPMPRHSLSAGYSHRQEHVLGLEERM